MSPVPAEAAAAALRRDLWACVCCGTPVTGRPHSARRRDPHAGDGLSNLLTFLGDGSRPGDPGDHRARVDSGDDWTDGARGFRLRADRDPALVPVMTASSGDWVTVWLDETESYAMSPPAGAMA